MNNYFFDGRMMRGNSVRNFYEGMDMPRDCDEVPVRQTVLPFDHPLAQEMTGSIENSPVRINPSLLTFGLRAHIERLVEIARACGFSNAVARPIRGGDIEPVPEGLGTNAFVLSAEEDASRRNGPLLCYIQLYGRYAIEAGLLP